MVLFNLNNLHLILKYPFLFLESSFFVDMVSISFFYKILHNSLLKCIKISFHIKVVCKILQNSLLKCIKISFHIKVVYYLLWVFYFLLQVFYILDLLLNIRLNFLLIFFNLYKDHPLDLEARLILFKGFIYNLQLLFDFSVQQPLKVLKF